jgi:hypothetical protein
MSVSFPASQLGCHLRRSSELPPNSSSNASVQLPVTPTGWGLALAGGEGAVAGGEGAGGDGAGGVGVAGLALAGVGAVGVAAAGTAAGVVGLGREEAGRDGAGRAGARRRAIARHTRRWCTTAHRACRVREVRAAAEPALQASSTSSATIPTRRPRDTR